MTVKSPVTNNYNTSVVTQFDVTAITKQYVGETKVDVSRFFKGLQKIELYQCNDTGYRFYQPDGIWGDGKFYEQLQENNSWYYSVARWEHKEALALISTEHKVLEIGCGDGAFLKMMSQNGIRQIEAIELNEKAANIARSAGFNVKLEPIETFAEKNNGQYDVICSFQVLEHIYEVKSFLDASLLVLKRGGKMIIAVPNNNPYIYENDLNHTLNLPPHHAGLWNKEVFEKLQNFYGIRLNYVSVRPMDDYRAWRIVQKTYYKKSKPLLGFLISIVPSFIHSMYLSVFKKPGRDILVEFIKK